MNPNLLYLPIGIILMTLVLIGASDTGEPPYDIVSPTFKKIEKLHASGAMSDEARNQMDVVTEELHETYHKNSHPYLHLLFFAEIGMAIALILLVSMRILHGKPKAVTIAPFT